jgi:hypothetical protein
MFAGRKEALFDLFAERLLLETSRKLKIAIVGQLVNGQVFNGIYTIRSHL